jgi:hypothetical protein
MLIIFEYEKHKAQGSGLLIGMVQGKKIRIQSTELGAKIE